MKRYLLHIGSAVGILVALLFGFAILKLDHSRKAPVAQTLSLNLNHGWEAFGGSWKQNNDFIENESEERGAKLMTGNDAWRNYLVEADVALTGSYGDAGLLIRSSNEEEGVDSYHGYFAGIRNKDNAFLLGRADFGWDQFAAPSMPHPIETGVWYHIKLVAYGCNIAASVTAPDGSLTAASAMDPQCIENGRIGIKSYSSSARWRNIRVEPSNQSLLTAVAAGTTPVIVGSGLPVRALGFTDAALDRYMTSIRREAQKHHYNSEAKTIASIKSPDTLAHTPATIHGVATVVSPALYVQDSTGSIEVRTPSPIPSLRVGDEIEASGNVDFREYTFDLQAKTIKPLWPNAPLSPLAVSVFEVAAGTHAGDLVELEAELLSRESQKNGFDRMIFGDGDQTFRAFVPQNSANDRLRIGSRVRLRGVVTHLGRFTDFQVPFALLLPTASSAQLIAPPPFWSTFHITLFAGACIMVVLALHVLVLRIQRWRARAVLAERERLSLEMHDTLAQSFAGIGFQLQAIQSETEAEHPARKNLDTALAMVRSSHEEAKRSIAALRPMFNSPRGLVEELCNFAKRLADGCFLEVDGKITGRQQEMSTTVGDAFFRIGQEAVSNALRHARASKLSIMLLHDERAVSLMISDNGCGFDRAARTVGLGIRGMKKRANDIGAHLEISSPNRIGTTVRVTLSRTKTHSVTRRLETVLDFIAGE